MKRRIVIVAVLFAAACTKQEPTPAPKPAEPASEVKQLDPSKDVRGLLNRLEHEATARPGSGVTAEQVFDALDRHGLRLDQRRQYLGAAAKASYCAGGTTAQGLAISVCEYADAAAALAGKQFMDREFAAMAATAVRTVHGSTVLTIVPPDRVAHRELVERAQRTFTSL